ncbi:MAG: VWA domain-containing protein [Deltaproteobacteria bacterium]|nr:VWA domain-containing protein [Deltaproteobacteria bacterium]
MTVMILVDMSASLDFGTRGRLKRESAAEVAAVLAYAAIKSNDKVGLILFTDRVEKFIPAKKGRGHVYRVIQEILTFTPQHPKTQVRVPLEYLIRVMNRRSICFLISDFVDEGYDRALAVAKRRHDMVCIQLFDPAEGAFPKAGWIQWRDPETGDLEWVNSSRAGFQKKYRELSEKILARPQKTFQSMGVDSVLIDQSKDYIQPLLQFFRFREKRQ